LTRMEVASELARGKLESGHVEIVSVSGISSEEV